MHPNISVLGIDISTYGILATTGILVSAAVCVWLCRRKGLGTDRLILTGLVSFIGVFIGAHLLYALTNIGEIISVISSYDSLGGIWNMMGLILPLIDGMVFYGGLFGGLFVGYLWLRRTKQDIPSTADVFAVVIPLFHGFGRIGCFFAGCCYGVESETGFSGRYTGVHATESIVRFPVQLLEASLLFLLFAVLAFLLIKGRFPGRLMPLYLSVYAVMRFCLEFLRGDLIRGIYLGLSTSQWISLAILLTVSATGLVRLIRRKQHSNRDVSVT